MFAEGKSRLEAKALESTDRHVYAGFNLPAAKAQLTQMLDQIGRTQQFSTYTVHDIAHIDHLLKTADWIIPSATLNKLTVGDALIMTLAIYVHDLGMLVTREEFEDRSSTEFPAFKKMILDQKNEHGREFAARLEKFRETDRENFLYEEFVRSHHAERIEAWVAKTGDVRWGKSSVAADIVDQIFSPLPALVREDVALVARSHHMDDLHDFGKYKLGRAYADEPEDIANLQYCAVVLRTVDLLHMTNDRTPTIQYRLASPTDPLGQVEWKKQQAVRTVRPVDVEDDRQANGIEIHGRFDNATGYFALNEYLDYVESQIKQSRDWVKSSYAQNPRAKIYLYPWDKIDRANIEAAGFRPEHYKFSFDHGKVLELLTGHTLYNDSSVAIRELVQNSIDAVRFSEHSSIDYFRKAPGGEGPDITITYDSANRIFTLTDRGIGMSLETIRNHFLCVGSSGYQTEAFKFENPEYISISRFGIGVLSAFMIADEVEVSTKTFEDRIGQFLVLRSVTGQYLIKDLESGSEAASAIGKNGTRIRMRLRSAADVAGGIEHTLRKFILFPLCGIEYTEDGDTKSPIGYDSPEQAIKSLMILPPEMKFEDVYTFERDGTTVSIPRTWNKLYKSWFFCVGRDGAQKATIRSRQRPAWSWGGYSGHPCHRRHSWFS
jgi:hypothetical protein